MSSTLSLLTPSQPTRVRLFFDQTSDAHFLVIAEFLSSNALEVASHISVNTFPHQDRFIERIVAADLPASDTSLLAAIVLQSVDPTAEIRKDWTEVSLSSGQVDALGLKAERYFVRPETTPVLLEPPIQEGSFDFADNAQFYNFLLQSPTPFVMLRGPEHRVNFINQPYLELIGILEEDILMKPFAEAVPEFEGQPFFGWLDDVYKTGIAVSRKGQVAYVRRPHGEGFAERYFDFIYYPVRDAEGKVYGVMAQAADVTERILNSAVSEEREDTLFRQWAELDSIYRTAPVGMALIEPKSLRLLRANEKQAEIMGAPLIELLGKRLLDLHHVPLAPRQLFERVGDGETVRNAILEKAFVEGVTGHRTWLVNICPFLGASGEVIAFTAISLEVPDEA